MIKRPLLATCVCFYLGKGKCCSLEHNYNACAAEMKKLHNKFMVKCRIPFRFTDVIFK